MLLLSEENFKKLKKLVDSLSPEEQKMEFKTNTLNRNIRDVLAHLHHWHLMVMDWYEVGMRGEKPSIPAKGYTWKTLPEFNKWINDKYTQTDLEKVKKMLDRSFGQVRNIIDSHSNEELFEKKRYNWTGSTSLGAYLISATSSHYDWAIKLIKRGIK
ncbi:ClbS/DfsB family four-helix bundle protein [Algoriphagus sediminis]|uniref:ClbS/DfsB family four-helix bundle protein n=1 Tax=Algoriphagus sediminis TaxID=3057113 RepID=A0ABT7YAA8_9BACT|nr:ClbS/DfsB family four-helix bundle protein [Algoriphagus sediminis]MDN3203340.1 ClbS/DfsB family four-helix bundle protein [Algoriphagus sediminis]